MAQDSKGDVGSFASENTQDIKRTKCLEKNLARVEKALKPHKKRVVEYKRRERAYKGDIDYDKDTWKHQVHPPFIFQNVETLEAQLVWDSTVTKVYPNKSGDEAAADSLEKLLKIQMDKDGLDQKWGAAVKSSLIYGPGILKVHWGQRFAITTFDDGTEETVVSFDQPTASVIDPKDFFLDPAATCITDARFCVHRYYQTRNYIEMMGESLKDEDGKELKPARWFNVKEALDSRSEDIARDSGKSVVKAQTDLDLSGAYEIWEIWDNEENKVIVIVNRTVLVQEDMSPFDHGELPFVDLYTIEDPFHFDKLSVVDSGIELQNARWEFGNQGLDAASLINNPIVKVASNVDDPDAFAVMPGAVWEVDRMDDVTIESWDNRVISGFRMVDEWLDKMMQDVMAATPFGPATTDNQVNPVTAAEVNAQQSVNGARITRARSLLGYSRKRLGKLWIALNQQFLTEPVEIRTIGPGGVTFHHVDPNTIQGQYDYYIESQQESTNRDQRRTEALNLLQTIAGLCGGIAQMEAMGFSVKAFVERLGAAYDIPNVDQFYQTPPPPPPPQPQQLPPDTSQPPAPPA